MNNKHSSHKTHFSILLEFCSYHIESIGTAVSTKARIDTWKHELAFQSNYVLKIQMPCFMYVITLDIFQTYTLYLENILHNRQVRSVWLNCNISKMPSEKQMPNIVNIHIKIFLFIFHFSSLFLRYNEMHLRWKQPITPPLFHMKDLMAYATYITTPSLHEPYKSAQIWWSMPLIYITRPLQVPYNGANCTSHTKGTIRIHFLSRNKNKIKTAPGRAKPTQVNQYFCRVLS